MKPSSYKTNKENDYNCGNCNFIKNNINYCNYYNCKVSKFGYCNRHDYKDKHKKN